MRRGTCPDERSEFRLVAGSFFGRVHFTRDITRNLDVLSIVGAVTIEL